MGDARLMRILFGDRRQYHDLPARSALAVIERTRPWEFGRIGAIEKQIWQRMTVGRFRAWCGKAEFTTGELARLIYADPLLHKLLRKSDAPPKLKSWQYDRIRRALPPLLTASVGQHPRVVHGCGGSKRRIFLTSARKRPPEML